MKYSIFHRGGSIIIFLFTFLSGLSCPSAVQPASKDILLDFSQKTGAIKALNGINIGTVKETAAWTGYMTRTYAELKIPLTRLHDCRFSNPGVVDIPASFPLFHVDPDDPGNYNFRKTYDYLLELLKSGTKISYRPGVDIEHGKEKYHIFLPEDYDKWAKICVNIIRHYNDGRAGGLNESGDMATIMISNYNAPVDTLPVRISGLPWKGGTRAEVFVPDNENDLTPLPDEQFRHGHAFTLQESLTAPVMKIIRLYPVEP